MSAELQLAAACSLALLLGWGLVGRAPHLLFQRRRLLAGLVAGLTLAALAALLQPQTPFVRTRLDASEHTLLQRDDPAAEVYRDAVATFGDDDMTVIVVTAPDVFTVELLIALGQVGDSIRKLPGVRRVESLRHSPDFVYDPHHDMIELGPFLEDVPARPIPLGAAKRRALAHRVFVNTLVAADGTAAALNVFFAPMSDGEYVELGLDAAILNTLAPLRGDGREVFVTGRKHVKAETHALMVHDLSLLIPIAVLVGAAVAWLLTGRFRNAAIPVGSSLLATLWVFALLAVLDRPLNLITLVLGPTLICVGSVYGVHVLARFDELLNELGDRRAAALECLRSARLPVSIAAATTVAGFGSLGLSSTPAIVELGLLCALGVAMVALLALCSTTLLLGGAPATEAGPLPTPSEAGVLPRALARLASTCVERPSPILAFWAATAVVAVLALPWIVIDTDYLTFFKPSSRIRRDFDEVGRHLSGALPLFVTVDGGEAAAFREPEMLRKVEELQTRFQALAGVDRVVSAIDFVALVNQAFEQGNTEEIRIPDTTGELSEVLFMIPKTELHRYASSDHRRLNLVVRSSLSGSAAIRDLQLRLRQAVDEVGLPASMRVEITGNTILVNRAADAVAGNQLRTVAVATVMIFLLISLGLGSLRLGLLALLPNLLPVLLFFGVLGCGVATLSLPTSLIGCIALGISVDDTAHFLVAYRRRRQRGASPEQAAAETIRVLGQPIVTTSMMLISGFAVLGFSGFATLQEFGYLTGLTMLLCLGADLSLLPALLVRAKI